ncbi:unnamed protein product [Rangifer tarandus platyrhynchus]|uniref:Uncharacterized protein n=1 Tax=Rangifer tarandus platyrhynchus TaxID=3082113 RepID=A0ABN8XZ79_RANTA|nr:unnamed protein product [Rangifer tarandus platyrhynchus]
MSEGEDQLRYHVSGTHGHRDARGQMEEGTDSGGHGKNPVRSEPEEPKSLPGPFYFFCGSLCAGQWRSCVRKDRPMMEQRLEPMAPEDETERSAPTPLESK